MAFSWEAARKELDGLPGGCGLNIAYEAVDRHAASDRRDHLAIRWLGKGGQVRDLTYGDLRALTNRFANVLEELGWAGASGSSCSPDGCRSCTSACSGR